MKSVCIVGAGPGGLVTAKTLLDTRQFDVTVFEKNHRSGGIWALDEGSTEGFLSPRTPTNLSRFTVSFTDLDWRKVDLNPPTHEPQNHESVQVPMFPKAWQCRSYLDTFQRKYVPAGTVKYHHEVVKAKWLDGKWRIAVKDVEGKEIVHSSDYLSVASGFFARPRLLHGTVSVTSARIRTVHTSHFRTLDDLFDANDQPAGKTILMLGGGNSSGETAASIALQLSNSQWSSDQTHAARYQGCRIIHVMPRPMYALPPYVEHKEGSKSYLPIDLKLYDLGRRAPGLASYAGRQTPEVRSIVHKFMQSMVGSDQSDISPALVAPSDESLGSTYVALSENYLEYVRSGMVGVVSGRVTNISEDDSGATTASVSLTAGGICTLHNIGAVINATGYEPSSALEFLDDGTKDAIQYDPCSTRLPLILEQWQTMSSAAPNLSFIGFYEGPYWPMMEMQARLTAHRWLNGNLAERRPYEQEAILLELRQAMHDKARDVPQFWFTDYVGYLQDVAEHLNLPRNDGSFGPREGCISPARFLSEHTNMVEANSTMANLYHIWNDCLNEGRFVARAVCRALHGNWKVSRTIGSKLLTFPSGTFIGEANFHPRTPTVDGSGMTFDLEYLYHESGVFTTSSGHSMTASRRYVYRYSEADDKLSVWFVKPGRTLEVDYIFHELAFVKPAEARKEGACVARADHLCVEDMYWTEYKLPLKGVGLTKFDVSHTVKGPEKDYVMRTTYERPA